jgi:hypothetical protein
MATNTKRPIVAARVDAAGLAGAMRSLLPHCTPGEQAGPLLRTAIDNLRAAGELLDYVEATVNEKGAAAEVGEAYLCVRRAQSWLAGRRGKIES